MKSRASAPGKVILFGEHFVVYGVKAVLCAINKRVYVTAEKTDQKKIVIKSDIGELTLEPDKTVSEIKSPLRPFYYLADKMIKNQDTGIKVIIESDIPPGVGLGSSSACCIAGASAISRLFKDTSREEVLKLGVEAEKTIFEDTSGADCAVCTYGGIIEYEKDKFQKIKTQPDFHLVIANSEIKRTTESVVAKVRRHKERDEGKFSALCDKESRLVSDALRLINENRVQELGEKVAENQEYLRDINVSNDILEEMIKIGQSTSFGAKITGAGGGGCIFALADESNLGNTIKQFRDKNYDCFSVKIDFKGLDTF